MTSTVIRPKRTCNNYLIAIAQSDQSPSSRILPTKVHTHLNGQGSQPAKATKKVVQVRRSGAITIVCLRALIRISFFFFVYFYFLFDIPIIPFPYSSLSHHQIGSIFTNYCLCYLWQVSAHPREIKAFRCRCSVGWVNTCLPSLLGCPSRTSVCNLAFLERWGRLWGVKFSFFFLFLLLFARASGARCCVNKCGLG